MSGRLKGIVLSVCMLRFQYSLKIFILQYIGWYVLVTWTFIVNQFSCFSYYYYYYYWNTVRNSGCSTSNLRTTNVQLLPFFHSQYFWKPRIMEVTPTTRLKSR